MSQQQRMNLHRLWSLFGLVPFVLAIIYPPWNYGEGLYRSTTRDWLWEGPLFGQIAVGQWALELSATLIIALVIIGVIFYVTPKWRASDSVRS